MPNRDLPSATRRFWWPLFVLLVLAALYGGLPALAAPPAQAPCVAIAYDQTQSGALNSTSDQRCYTFGGLRGQRINALLDTPPGRSLRLSLVLPGGARQLCGYGSGKCEIDDFTLPTNGTYTLVVASDGAATGGYTLHLNRLDSAPRPIGYGQSLTDAITPAGDQDAFRFEGRGGEEVTAILDSDIRSQASLRLTRPNGESWFCNFYYGDCAIEAVTLPITGPYTLTVDGFGASTGAYTLTLNRLDDGVEPIVRGVPLTRAISPPGDRDRYTFNAVGGHRVSAYLVNPTGARLGLRLDSPINTFALCPFSTEDCEIDDELLPATGPYTLTVDGEVDATGPYTLILNHLNDTATPITLDQTIAGEIAPLGDADLFAFNALPERHITLFLDNRSSGSLGLRLSPPDGPSIASCPASETDCQIDALRLPMTGTYTVTVDGQGATLGGYALTLTGHDDPPTPLAVGQPVAGAIAPPGDQDRYRINGIAGQSLRVMLRNGSGQPLGFTLDSPVSTTWSCAFAASDCVLDGIVFPTTGPYTLTVDGLMGATGDYTIVLAPATASPTPTTTPTATATASATPDPRVTPTVTASPSATATASATPSPSVTPSATATAGATTTASATASPSASPTRTTTPTSGWRLWLPLIQRHYP